MFSTRTRRFTDRLSLVVCMAVAVLATSGRLTLADERPTPKVNLPALRAAIEDLSQQFGEQYPHAQKYLSRLAKLEAASAETSAETQKAAVALQREALLANPLVDFEQILLVKRGKGRMGLPMNWQGNESIAKTGYDNEISILSKSGELKTLFRPEGGQFVGDVELHYDGSRMMFSMPNENGRWQVFEIAADGSGLKQLSLINGNGVDNYDACYSPDGAVLFTSTAPRVGVPCVTGSSHVANLFRLEGSGDSIRQLTFDQEHNWCPTVLDNGRVMYLRWEYSDIPHFVARIMFSMNPDGTDQKAYYGSNSYWPNAMFFGRPIPDGSGRFVAIVSGHHDVPRMGEMILFDPAKGEFEADGVVQRIMDSGKKVEPIIKDGLVKASWPKFLHPWPLSDKHFLVSAQPSASANWGIYLVDTFDNLVLIKEIDDYALIEPIPLQARKLPKILPNRVVSDRTDATVYLEDIYAGAGLQGVPKGTIKELRLFSYHYAFHSMGGQTNHVGLDGPWDVKRIMGTVPVAEDGSALFKIPANTPISVQPLDGEGKSLQLMRSWLTAMPGETLSCTGCHGGHRQAPNNHVTLALQKTAEPIKPWYGPTRGFSFVREVQPVLDRHCVGCHDDKPGTEGHAEPNFLNGPFVHANAKSAGYNKTLFPPSYLKLRSFVRSHTIESDMHMLPPGEFHADTTKLIQILSRGHHGVKLDRESWDRLITWIDLNTPAHGTWHEIVGEKLVGPQNQMRRDTLLRYAGRDEDPEAIYPAKQLAETAKEKPVTKPQASKMPTLANWPFDAKQAVKRQRADGDWQREINLGDSIKIDLVRIPAGQFVMGDSGGNENELSPRAVKIEWPFWIGRTEITNREYAQFDASHDSGLEHGDFLQFSDTERGWSLNEPEQPATRVSWNRAVEFCDWLSQQTGMTFSLPTETQWEYACRAGTSTPMAYGAVDTDFTKFANLADSRLKGVELHGWGLPVGAIPPWRLGNVHVDDKHRVSAPVASYAPNNWGLFDMHGNAAEWTRKDSRPATPFSTVSVRTGSDNERQVIRGGSWYDRSKNARSAARKSYRPYQRVFDVGFRVVCTDAGDK